MRIIVAGRVQNECDIIESWVRYNLCYADQMLIYDNQSTDSTRHILECLIREGLPLVIVNDELPSTKGMTQDKDVPYLVDWATQYANLAFEKYNADIVIHLDADEFLSANSGLNPRHVLDALDVETLVTVPWRGYICDGVEMTDNCRFMPEYFPRYRDASMEEYYKVIMTRVIFQKEAPYVTMGHHGLMSQNGDLLPSIASTELFIAHYPIHSEAQLIRKAVNGYLHILSREDKGKDHSFQWKDLYYCYKSDGMFSKEDLFRHSLFYACKEKKYTNPHCIEQPLATGFLEVPIKLCYTDYSQMKDYCREAILDFCEQLALDLSDIRIAYGPTGGDAEYWCKRATKAETAEAELAAVYASTSWKSTSWLRKIGEVLLGRRRKK